MSADAPTELTAEQIAQQIASKTGVGPSQIAVFPTPTGGWDANIIVATPAAAQAKAGLAQIVRAMQPIFKLKR